MRKKSGLFSGGILSILDDLSECVLVDGLSRPYCDDFDAAFNGVDR